MATLAALVLAGGAAVFPTTASAAPNEAPTVVAQAWAWRLQEPGLPSLATASGVRDGQLPVSWSGRDDKVSYLEIAPPPTEANQLALTLALDDSGANLNTDQADLIACVITQPLPGESPIPWQEQPEHDCDAQVRGAYQPATNDFYFDLEALLSRFAEGTATGILIAPDPATDVPAFQVVFASAMAGGAQLTSSSELVPTGDGSPSDDAIGPPPSNAAPLAPTSRWPASDAFTPPSSAGSSIASPGLALPSTADSAPTDRTMPIVPSSSAPLPTGDRRSSFVAFYNGLAALSVLLAARPITPAVVALLRQGTTSDRAIAGLERQPRRD